MENNTMGNSNRKLDYDIIFKLYELEKFDLYEKKKIRQQIKYYLNKYLKKIKDENKDKKPDTKITTWYDLSKEEQDHFICCEIKDKLKERHRSEDKKRKIDGNLKRYSLNTLAETKELIKEWNDSVVNIWKIYCQATDSYEKKRKAYEELCSDMKAYNKIVPVPSFEQFSKNPRRAYDYIQDFYESRVDMTPILIRIILQVLERELGLKIDYSSIMDCLFSLESCYEKVQSLGFDFEDFDKFPTDYEDNTDKAEDDADEAKKNFDQLRMEFGKYQRYQKKLYDLTTFYKIDRFNKKTE